MESSTSSNTFDLSSTVLLLVVVLPQPRSDFNFFYHYASPGFSTLLSSATSMRYFFVFKTLIDIKKTMVKYIRTFIVSLFLFLLELPLYKKNIKRTSKKTMNINVNGYYIIYFYVLNSYCNII